MARYATGTFHGDGYELYGIYEHVSDDAALTAFQAAMTASHPEVELVPCDHEASDAWEFVARVDNDFPLDAETIEDDDILELVETYDTADADADAA